MSKGSGIKISKFAKVYSQCLSTRVCAEHFGITRWQANKLYHKAIEAGLITPLGRKGMPSNEDFKAAPVPEVPVAGRLKAPPTPAAPRKDGGVTRFILTCAQNNTLIHAPLLENLQALADHYGARLMVARQVYNRFARAASFDKKLIIEPDTTPILRQYKWADEITSYLHDERLELAPGLVWCGETNIIPTASDPLSGLDSYTGRNSSIIPHPRIAMRSVASHPSEGTKLMYTTGTLTQRNYIQRKAGQLAEFHHCYGALLVEVDRGGTWFTRQLNADSDGTIYDWDLRVSDGRVTKGRRLEAITWGDIHVAYGDPVTYNLAWGEGGMMDQLKPRYQFMHDLIDFRARNGHNIKLGDNLRAFFEFMQGHIRVEDEMKKTAEFLRWSMRDYCQTVVVDSNHDHFLIEWLNKLGDFRKDHENSVYFLEAAAYLWGTIRAEQRIPNMTQWAMERADPALGARRGLRYLGEDESFIICPDAHGGIEGGLHGHERFNGAAGSPKSFAKTGRKTNIGHRHSAGIYDGTYVAGLMGLMKQGYNVGMSSWSQSNIFTYENGKRAIQTIYDGKARAL